jgi:putative ABC transport system ATP-binding protein
VFHIFIVVRGCPELTTAPPAPNSFQSETTTADAMIVVSGLRKSLQTGSTTVDILKGIDFTIARGEFAAIMGASGSGKSTLLGLLAGLDNPTSGSVSLNGVAISNLAEDKLAQLRGRTIGFVFQRVALARAFILRPPIVLADEPTGNLDTANGSHILDLLLHLNHVEGTTLVLVTHDPALAAHAGRRITLRDGIVVSDETQTPVPHIPAGA